MNPAGVPEEEDELQAMRRAGKLISESAEAESDYIELLESLKQSGRNNLCLLFVKA